MAYKGNTSGGGKNGGAAGPIIRKLFYTVQEACHVTGLKRSTLYAAMAKKRLSYFKVGARTLFTEDALVSWTPLKTSPTAVPARANSEAYRPAEATLEGFLEVSSCLSDVSGGVGGPS